ncbi:GHMP kinase, partial [archaeon]
MKFSSTSYDHSSHSLDDKIDAAFFKEQAKQGGFLSYVYGTMSVLLEHVALCGRAESLPGIWMDNYLTSLPMKKGLSSSAAVCVLVVKAFALHYNIPLDTAEVMDLAYKGEMRTPSHCGKMDQCVAMGGGRAALMTFDDDAVDLQILQSSSALHFVVIDLKGEKDTVVILS